MRQTTLFVAVTTLVATLTGCAESIESKNVKTDGIHADITATGHADGETHLRTTLRTGGPNSNTYVDLGPKDSFVYHVDGETMPAERSSGLGERVYYNKTVSKNEDGMPMRADLQREHGSDRECDGFGSAPNSTATLPKNFSITSPSDGTSFSRENDEITVQIDNTAETSTVAEIRGDCLADDYTREFSEDTATFEAGTLDKEKSEEEEDDVPDECEATLEVTRSRSGSVDSAYENGDFTARQLRDLTFTTQP